MIQENQSVVLFDGVCNLCNGAVQFIIVRDKKQKFLYASLQSEYGQKFLKERGLPQVDLSSIILYKPNAYYYTESTAVLQIVKELGFPYALGYIFIIIPKRMRDAVYKWIAQNRYKWFGKKEQCMLPKPEWKERFLE